MFEAVTWPRVKTVFAMIAVTAAAVSAYEFRILKRPTLAVLDASLASSVANEEPAPAFGLANVSFACATSSGFVTGVQVEGGGASASCSSGFTEATTRCASNGPLRGFGEQIKCAPGEAIHCAGGPLQALGLFKDDSFCGDVSDRDMGPPGDADRAASDD
jgi:hypothetical protein